MIRTILRSGLYPLLLLLTALLVAGCASGADESAGEAPTHPAATAASASPQPDLAASPSPGEAAVPGTGASSVPGSSAAPATAAPAPQGAAGETAAASTPQPAQTQAPAATAEPAATKPATARPAATQSPASKPAATKPAATQSAAPTAQAAAERTVTLTIVGDEEFGTILAPAAYEAEEGESVLELLKRITRKHKIPLEFQGAGSFAYVEGIGNLYEGDRGAESGWMYKVNGEFPDKAAGGYTVSSGDSIEWLYTLDLGKDLGASQ
ncbi:DUF4430 domain-containing protein [Paenibacillus tepidiphilus]|uniref:DUF4430 domain-containing protein n=1 Tax=Paenibacillus tepidiphilus TaxID=2608683 RepID=UPI001238901D|nr:DUF4430 domain-containing protein [Paenibacillus tepidiphilus]